MSSLSKHLINCCVSVAPSHIIAAKTKASAHAKRRNAFAASASALPLRIATTFIRNDRRPVGFSRHLLKGVV